LLVPEDYINFVRGKLDVRQIMVNGPRIICNRSRLKFEGQGSICDGPRITFIGPRVIFNGPKIIFNGPTLVCNGPRHI
jgi:hypothetical protein